MAKRRVIRGGTKGLKASIKRFLTSFTPNGFKRYWLNADGARRFGKIAGMGALLVFLVFLYFAKDLPSPGKINARIGSQNTEFYDRTGKVKIYEVHGDKNRRVIPFNDIPKNVKDATIAIEDRNFYKHGAFSPLGILRAAFVDVTSRGVHQGGSTITQQYVKNALLDPTDRSFTRKIKELILSMEMEALYKKDDILKLYLNEIPYGNQAYGIESACRTYFPENTKDDKCAANLTLRQATMLAAIPNLPTYYSPYGLHQDALVGRQNHILDLMVEQKMLSKGEAQGAKVSVATLASDTSLAARPHTQTATSPYPHFAQYAEDFLINKYNSNIVENGGLKVITTLDLDKQKLAQDAVNRGMRNVRALGGSNVALVSADPKTGQVLAMLGSYDANDPDFGAFNVALANRQPGSSFKPFVYSTAWAQNKNGCATVTAYCPTWGPGSTIYDVPTDFGGGYKPKNFAGHNFGVQSMRTALDGSLNIPAVKTLYIAGVANSIKTAHSLGITTLNDNPGDYGLSLVLGSGEVKLNDMVNAYESFANTGVHYEATPILKVTDPHNRTLEDNSKPKSKRVLDQQIAYLMANVLSDNKSRAFVFGSNNPLNIPGRHVGAKTGTTELFNDAWTMGFSPDLVTGVWSGNNNNKPMSSQAANIAAPIWNDYMRNALKDYPVDSDFAKPSGIKTVTLDSNTGKLPGPNTKSTRTDIFPSWYKPENTAGSRTANVDKVSGKLATSCTPPGAVESRTSSEMHAELAPTDPSYSRWEAPIAALAKTLGYDAGGALPTDNDDVHHCDDIKPTVKVKSTDSSPSGTFSIKADVTSGTFPANNLTIYSDDQVISTQAISGSTSYSFEYAAPAGSHTIKAVVTDTGLYSGDDETTLTSTGASSGGAGGTTGFRWPDARKWIPVLSHLSYYI
ncbi:MAG TPA: transglycosylase domain-containing protein [Candidatus Saccharimonadales bacterium]|nr:transglycosylase domain-containing protein [Candidatus Saccharimonadales bacterium]